jgi:hypothetical protein
MPSPPPPLSAVATMPPPPGGGPGGQQPGGPRQFLAPRGGPPGLPTPGGANLPSPSSPPRPGPSSRRSSSIRTKQRQRHRPPASQSTAAEPEEERKSNVGLIVGIIGGTLAILGVVAFFVFGPGLGGAGEDKPEQTEVSESNGKPEAAITNITIDVTPADATVMIDGKEFAGAGPRAIAELRAGVHKLEVSKDDAFLPYRQEVTFTAGQNLPIKLEARDVVLNITVTPLTATISLLAGTTATEIGKGSQMHRLRREPGLLYTIKGSAEGFEDLSIPVVFTGDPMQDMRVVLAKTINKVSKRTTAELTIGVKSGSPPATVTVDGKTEGRTPVFVKVSAGSHIVKWNWDDGKTDTQKHRVADNESKLVRGNR